MRAASRAAANSAIVTPRISGGNQAISVSMPMSARRSRCQSRLYDSVTTTSPAHTPSRTCQAIRRHRAGSRYGITARPSAPSPAPAA